MSIAVARPLRGYAAVAGSFRWDASRSASPCSRCGSSALMQMGRELAAGPCRRAGRIWQITISGRLLRDTP